MRLLYILSAIILFYSCNQPKMEQTENETPKTQKKVDVHSFSEPENASVTHLDWVADLNFDQKIISATATWTISANDKAKSIIFDTRNLEIISVTDSEGKELKNSLGEKKGFLGSPLKVEIPKQGNQIVIQYKTSPNAAALQWLNPEQTADKSSPFLFTQSQAILARTWLPCQDSPAIRFSYNANVKTPKGLMAVMSAKNPIEVSPNGAYSFEMTQPIPAYLMALAVGNFKYKKIGTQTGVYAEPSVLEKAAYEFADMQKMVDAASNLYGAYDWEQFDVIILPPSFPFGGMENPRITFATPTIIAGDRSLTALIAHELAHSWSGNLVTNSNWNDFWLNEGFTVYFERRIIEALYGREYAEMLALLGYQDLEGILEELKDSPNDTKLKLNLENRDPDDGMTDIAYEKGYAFLRLMENSFGRAEFDSFLKNYFQENKFKSMTTEGFLTKLDAAFGNHPEYKNIGVKQWVYESGLPSNCPIPLSTKFDEVETAIQLFMNGENPKNLKTKDYTSHEWLHFIRHLPNEITNNELSKLDQEFNFTTSGNCEILAAWFIFTIKNNYEPAKEVLDSFLINVGRRKFLTPTYKAILKTENGSEKAISIYKKARKNYHAVSIETLDNLLNFKE